MVRLVNVPLPEPNLIGIAAAACLHRIRPWPLPGPRNVRLVGWPLIAAGACLIARSVAVAAELELAHPDRLVTSGPYAVSRNPMYVGWALLHLGVGAAGRSVWIIATFPGAAWCVHRQVMREERALAEEFEEEYRRYQAVAPRYLPPWRSFRREV